MTSTDSTQLGHIPILQGISADELLNTESEYRQIIQPYFIRFEYAGNHDIFRIHDSVYSSASRGLRDNFILSLWRVWSPQYLNHLLNCSNLIGIWHEIKALHKHEEQVFG